MDIAENIAKHYHEILKLIGEDPTREGLVDTPMRAARALIDATCGTHQTAESIVNDAIFSTTSNGMITISAIPFFSTCEHHLMPFEGHVSIAYLPNGTLLGLSKIPRIVSMFAHRLQIQEQLTQQIADEIHRLSNGLGVIVTISAKHSCMRARGIKSEGTMTTTVALGQFLEYPLLQSQFWNSVCTN